MNAVFYTIKSIIEPSFEIVKAIGMKANIVLMLVGVVMLVYWLGELVKFKNQ